jgi:hypothetical protein
VTRPGRWINAPAPDAALALVWVPFALAAHLMESNGALIRALLAVVMFLSFTHQPLTLPFVYASPWRLATHRRVFLWSPVVALVVIALFSQVSMVLVAIVGGLWNAEHTLMQRYGITRIYGRQAGDDLGSLEKAMLVGWLVIPVVSVAARGQLDHVIQQFGSGTVTGNAATFLVHMSSEARIALPVVVLAAVYLTARWLRAQRRLPSGANPGKWLYLASTAGLFAFAIGDPMAGVIGFVASHSVEYFVIVRRSIGGEARHEGTLGRIARAPHGPLWFFAAYAGIVSGLFVALYWFAPARVVLVTVLTIGAVHFFYDSFIWKLRKPAVAAPLVGTAGVRTGAPAAMATSRLASAK